MCWNTQNWSYSASFLFSLGFKASGKQLSPCWIIDYREQSWMQPATLLLYQSACPAQSLSLSAATTSNARFHQCSHFHPGQIFMHMLFYISYICCLHSWLVANYSISVMQNSYARKVRLGNEFCTLCFWMIMTYETFTWEVWVSCNQSRITTLACITVIFIYKTAWGKWPAISLARKNPVYLLQTAQYIIFIHVAFDGYMIHWNTVWESLYKRHAEAPSMIYEHFML